MHSAYIKFMVCISSRHINDLFMIMIIMIYFNAPISLADAISLDLIVSTPYHLACPV